MLNMAYPKILFFYLFLYANIYVVFIIYLVCVCCDLHTVVLMIDGTNWQSLERTFLFEY